MHGNFGLFAGIVKADFLSDIYQPFECMTDVAWRGVAYKFEDFYLPKVMVAKSRDSIKEGK